MSLPEYINVSKVVTYDVETIAKNLREMNDDPNYEPTLLEITEYIDDWVFEDFGDNYGLIYTDENGEEL